mmetsp:Transcript_80206/g.214282  ORF Transcript_80206/g.214282 Transcript_80206/m.214282 type:complete len:202 (-) Transcript_80206:153-758(-)
MAALRDVKDNVEQTVQRQYTGRTDGKPRVVVEIVKQRHQERSIGHHRHTQVSLQPPPHSQLNRPGMPPLHCCVAGEVRHQGDTDASDNHHLHEIVRYPTPGWRRPEMGISRAAVNHSQQDTDRPGPHKSSLKEAVALAGTVELSHEGNRQARLNQQGDIQARRKHGHHRLRRIQRCRRLDALGQPEKITRRGHDVRHGKVP